MENEVIVLIITYPNDKDVNISAIRDDLTDKDILKEIKDRELDIEQIKKKDEDFHAELYDYDGNIVFETKEWTKTFFKKIFRVIDGLSPKELKGVDNVLETETLSLNLPSDDYIANIEEKVEERRELEENEEIDVEEINDGADQNEDVDVYGRIVEQGLSDKNISKSKYLKMKKKYLNLKQKFLKQISNSN